MKRYTFLVQADVEIEVVASTASDACRLIERAIRIEPSVIGTLGDGEPMNALVTLPPPRIGNIIEVSEARGYVPANAFVQALAAACGREPVVGETECVSA